MPPESGYRFRGEGMLGTEGRKRAREHDRSRYALALIAGTRDKRE